MDIIDNSRYITKIDIKPLFDFCVSLEDEDWEEFTFRQNNFKAHSSTKTVAAIFPDRSNFPNMKKMTFKHTEQMMTLFDPAIQAATNFYNEKFVVTTAMIVLLMPDENVEEHSDTHPYFGLTHRFHICIHGDYDNMDFLIRGMKVDMNLGDVIEINNRLPHKVVYRGKKPRLNAIFDLLPASKL
jgi:hypothetical protein